MANVMDHLKCPICFEIPEGKVYQCKNGHTFCALCSSKLKVCPHCRVVLGWDRIRNRTLENILDATKFTCPNKDQGCFRVLDRKDIGSHLLFCKFEPFYFCKLIGFQSCSFNAAHSEGSASNLVTHLDKCHPEIQETIINSQNSWVSLNYKRFFSLATTLDRNAVKIWTPHLIRDGENVFILLCQVSEQTKNAAWICLRLTTDKPRGDHGAGDDVSERKSSQIIHYQITGERKHESKLEEGGLDLLTPRMTWKAPVLKFTDIDKELDEYALRVPVSVLNSFANSQDDLGISIQLERTEATHFQEDIKEASSISELSSFVTNSKLQYLATPHSSPEIDDVDNNQRNDDEDNENQVIFPDVFCNGCGLQRLVQLRYKCLQCEDFDLCKTCMDRGDTHMHHVFARVHSIQQTQLLNTLTSKRRISKRLSLIHMP